MTTKKNNNEIDSNELFKTVLAIKEFDDVAAFFKDLLTARELIDLSQRWRVARMLNDGVSYVEIERQTGMSSTTIARISKNMKSDIGGYKRVLKKMDTPV